MPNGDRQRIELTSLIVSSNHLSAFSDSVAGVLTISKLANNRFAAAWRQGGTRIEADSLSKGASSLTLERSQGRVDKNRYPHIYGADSVAPTMATLIPTYRCNAACEQCCFESNPKIKHRLSLEEMITRVDEALDAFPEIYVLVVSGGECFLLGDDLIQVLRHAASRGLYTRCVSNGFWGRTETTAKRIVQSLVDAGIREMNFSTGKDHQQWVPVDHVVRAAGEVAAAGIVTLITIEADDDGDDLARQVIARDDVKGLLKQPNFSIQTNTWMPFRPDAQGRGPGPKERGCDQLFNNYVITPHEMLSACCGLTFEHIPEMKLADLSGGGDVRTAYLSQLDDFLKIWIHIDGPTEIMRRLFGVEAIDETLAGVNHICQSCAILHKHPGVREALIDRYHEFVPEVLSRFNLKRTIRDRLTRGVVTENDRTNIPIMEV